MGFNGTDRELLELILNQVTELTMDMSGVKGDMSGLKREVSGLKSEVSGLKSEMSEVKGRLSGVEKTVLRIEHDHGDKLSALFDGYQQNSEKLDRIEAEVARHEEIILRRVR